MVKTDSDIFGSSSERIYQRIPHKITIQDMENLLEIADIIHASMVAQFRGLSYTWPKNTMCNT